MMEPGSAMLFCGVKSFDSPTVPPMSSINAANVRRA